MDQIRFDACVVISNGKIKTLTNLLWTKLPSKGSLVLRRHCRCFSSIPTGRPEVVEFFSTASTLDFEMCIISSQDY